jgi:hypothetical protein
MPNDSQVGANFGGALAAALARQYVLLHDQMTVSFQ